MEGLVLKKDLFDNSFLDIYDIFSNFLINDMELTKSRISPIHDVIETDDEFIVEMDLAGIDKKDIHIDINDDVLVVNAERKRNEKLNYRRKEFYVGKYMRSFTLPKNTDVEKIKAEFKNGILKITIPKNEKEKSKKKMIEIT